MPAGHSVWALEFARSRRWCNLDGMRASHLKKRRTPYQTPGQDLDQLTHAGSPSSTQARCAAVISRHGVSSGMPRFFAYFTRSSWHSLKLCVCHGLTAPSRSDFDSFGTTRPKSTPITRPKPRHASHAPIGELNENAAGVGSE